MTIEEVLAEVDEIKPNTFDDAMKIRWLSDVDGKVFSEIMSTHEDEDAPEEFNGYTVADMSTDLLVGYPFSDIYSNYVYAMIDYSNGETDRYQNSMLMFNSKYQQFLNHYNKNHKPKSNYLKIF